MVMAFRLALLALLVVAGFKLQADTLAEAAEVQPATSAAAELI